MAGGEGAAGCSGGAMDEELSHHRAGKRMETKTQHTGVASITFDRAAALKRVLAERRRSMLIDLSITLLTILLALGLGFIVMLMVTGWHPTEKGRAGVATAAVVQPQS